MKKLLMLVVGMVLFTAGYHHNRRQAEYTTAQATVLQTEESEKLSVPSHIQHTFAFRLVNPS